MPTIVFARRKTQINASHLRKCMNALLRYSGKKDAFLEISLVGNVVIRKLNKKFRKKDRVTDVLSFPLDSRPPRHGGPWHLGEILICVPVASAQAKRAGRSLAAQTIRLAVHGLVHLGGWDHEKSSREKKRFESLEKKYLAFLRKQQ